MDRKRKTRIRILLADDHEIMRQGLKALLHKQSDVKVVGQASDGRQALNMAAQLSPDIVIMDITMPNLNGIEATRQITTRHPDTKVMALSAHFDVSILSKMLTAGATGFMLKDSAFLELMDCINAMAQNTTYICSRISNLLFDDYPNLLTHPKRSTCVGLTLRESEVLQLVAEGKASKEIAEALKVSVKTVGNHREHIMKKLVIHDTAGLTKYALREKLTFVT